MKHVLVINGHPSYENSLSNRVILDELKKAYPHFVERQLSKLYPNYVFDVAKEQAELVKADVVVFEFPFFWYSFPAILKKYIDDVFAPGFAYGVPDETLDGKKLEGGDKLHGKRFICSFTTGGDKSAYTATGYNKYTIEELTTPFRSIASFVGMEYDIVFTNGALFIPGMAKLGDEHRKKEVTGSALVHAKKLIAKLK